MTKITREFSYLGIERGGINMFRAPEALKIIDICHERGIGILGIDSFIITETTTQPMIENSIDYTARGKSEPSSWSLAQEFIESLSKKDFYFEIVTDDRQ
jgi:hypothetical protein